MSMKFNFSEDVKALGITGVYFVIDGMKNKKSDDYFEELSTAYYKSLDIDAIRNKIETSNVLCGFRELHDAINCSGKKFVSAPENLYNFFLAHNNLPRINLIVDIYNYVSFLSELALGAHDTQFVSGNINFRLTTGTENFQPLGSPKTMSIKSGEYCYIDEANDVLCRLEVRQVEKTKVTENTTSCFYIVQGNKNTSPSFVIDVAKKLVDLTVRCCGGEVSYLYVPEGEL